MTDSASGNNFRNPVMAEPLFMPPTAGVGDVIISPSLGADTVLRTIAGNVRSLQPPPLPMAPTSQYSMGMGGYGGGFGGYNNNFSNYGGGYAGLGYGGYNSLGGAAGYSGYGGSYTNYNRFGMSAGMNPMDPETRFIQLAEASSRPAFQSIESLVSAIGNIASMLDSTFFALTSSFRAILGVAANFGRLRGVFAQFWSTFAIYRGLSFIYRKILYWLRISNLDPSSEIFKKAFAEAMNEANVHKGAPKLTRKGQSPWPVLAFLTFIFTAPYLIMKLLGTVTNTAHEEARNPSKWIQPVESVALYDFQARNSSELTIRLGQRVIIAPREIQHTLALLNTGWAIATTDGQTTGMIPINYVKSPQQMRDEQLRKATEVKQSNSFPSIEAEAPPQPSLMNLSTSAFAAPPDLKQQDRTIPDFDMAPQPLGPPTAETVAMQNDV